MIPALTRQTTSPARLNPSDILGVALWFGVTTALGELLLLGIKRFVLGKYVRFGLDVLWLVPAADAVLFFAIGAILVAIGRAAQALRSPKHLVVVLAFFSAFSGALLYDPLHGVARILLAAGIAAQVSRVMAPRSSEFLGLVRRTLPVIVALVVAIGVGVWIWRMAITERSVSALPRALPVAPHVLLIVLDTVGAQRLSLYGYSRPTTPHLDRWAARGVVFDRATATAPWTLPSHGSLFTGRWADEQAGRFGSAMDRRFPTLAEVLAAHGYATAGFVANTHFAGYESGLATIRSIAC